MRIRFVTRDQLQVLQASRMEKHTIPDGTIPLYGLSPSAVSKQWGIATKEYANGIMTWEYPVTVKKVLKILTGEAYPTSWLQNTSLLYASISAASDNSIGLSSANIITLSITSGGSVTLSSHTTACVMIGSL